MGKKSKAKRDRRRGGGDDVVMVAFKRGGQYDFCQPMQRSEYQALLKVFGPYAVELIEEGTYELVPGRLDA